MIASASRQVIDSTPETTEAVSDTKTIKVDSKESLPTVAKLSHVLSLIVAIAAALAVLADGNSVIHLKDPQYLPIITNPNLKSIGFNHRADELLGLVRHRSSPRPVRCLLDPDRMARPSSSSRPISACPSLRRLSRV